MHSPHRTEVFHNKRTLSDNAQKWKVSNTKDEALKQKSWNTK